MGKFDPPCKATLIYLIKGLSLRTPLTCIKLAKERNKIYNLFKEPCFKYIFFGHEIITKINFKDTQIEILNRNNLVVILFEKF
jgi:hypothetical protein